MKMTTRTKLVVTGFIAYAAMIAIGLLACAFLVSISIDAL
jgi:hypothetical protein